MRLFRVTVLFAVLCLHGCDGSIRSCLASEQRKAEQALNLEEAVTLQVRLEALSELDELLARHLVGTTAWIEDNPQPIGKPSRPTPPSLRCGEVAFGNERDQCRSKYDLEWDNYKKIGRNSRKRWPIINGQWPTSTGRSAPNKRV